MTQAIFWPHYSKHRDHLLHVWEDIVVHAGEAALVLLAQCEHVLVIVDWERTQLNTSAWGTCPEPAPTQHSLSQKGIALWYTHSHQMTVNVCVWGGHMIKKLVWAAYKTKRDCDLNLHHAAVVTLDVEYSERTSERASKETPPVSLSL